MMQVNECVCFNAAVTVGLAAEPGTENLSKVSGTEPRSSACVRAVKQSKLHPEQKGALTSL